MKEIVYTFTFLVIGFVFNSCSTIEEESDLEKTVPEEAYLGYQSVSTEENFSLKIPSHMTVTSQLSERASLQFSNPFKEKYITVVEKKRDEFILDLRKKGGYLDSKSPLENFASNDLRSFIGTGISILNKTTLKREVINELKVVSTVLDMSSLNRSKDYTYYFYYFEGEKSFYAIKAWTLLDRKETYSDEIELMMDSFQEL